MEQYKTNQLSRKNNKFKSIENHFMILFQSSDNNLKKQKSHLNLLQRPYLILLSSLLNRNMLSGLSS
jgi:hypothetical protein